MPGLLEWFIKKVGSSPFIANKLFGTDEMVPPDEPYLKQYMQPEKDILAQQRLRPTRLTVTDVLPWRSSSMPDAMAAILRREPLGGSNAPEARPFSAKDALTIEDLNQLAAGQLLENVYPISTGSSATEGLVGLGHFTSSVGRDPRGPYLSVYDKWDFGSPVVTPLVGALMKRVGQPYHIYDRFDIEPESDIIMRLQRRK